MTRYFLGDPMWSNEGTTCQFQQLSSEQWLKPGPESGLDCLICAGFTRQRTANPGPACTGTATVVGHLYGGGNGLGFTSYDSAFRDLDLGARVYSTEYSPPSPSHPDGRGECRAGKTLSSSVAHQHMETTTKTTN